MKNNDDIPTTDATEIKPAMNHRSKNAGARDLWDETVWRWDYRSEFNLTYSEVCAIARGNCDSKSTARRLA